MLFVFYICFVSPLKKLMKMPPVIHNREWISKSSIWFCHQELCTSHLQPPLSTLDFTTFFLPTLKDKWTIANSERKFLFVHLLNFSKFLFEPTATDIQIPATWLEHECLVKTIWIIWLWIGIWFWRIVSDSYQGRTISAICQLTNATTFFSTPKRL